MTIPQQVDKSSQTVDELLGQYGSLVWTIAFRAIGTEQDAEDCFQEVFLVALNSLATGEIRNWRGFLARVTHRQAMMVLRRRYAQRSRIVTSSDVANLVSDQPSPMQSAADAELAECLRFAISQLPEQLAEVYCLREQHDLSYEDIARELNASRNQVGVMLHRARAALQKTLACHFPETQS